MGWVGWMEGRRRIPSLLRLSSARVDTLSGAVLGGSVGWVGGCFSRQEGTPSSLDPTPRSETFHPFIHPPTPPLPPPLLPAPVWLLGKRGVLSSLDPHPSPTHPPTHPHLLFIHLPHPKPTHSHLPGIQGQSTRARRHTPRRALRAGRPGSFGRRIEEVPLLRGTWWWRAGGQGRGGTWRKVEARVSSRPRPSPLLLRVPACVWVWVGGWVGGCGAARARGTAHSFAPPPQISRRGQLRSIDH